MDKPRPKYGILEFTEAVLRIRAYQWQRRTLCSIAAGYPTALVAANGSGKTSTILVPAALWCLFSWPGARVTVIATAGGNRLQIVAAFRERDAVQCVRRGASTLRERQLTNFVSADAGGIGGPMCAQLSSDFGIYTTRVNNGSPVRKKDDYANADAATPV